MSSNNNVVIEMKGEPISSMSTTAKGMLAALFYGVCSVGTAFINKALMTSMKFDFPVFIMVVQMMFTIILLETLSFCRVLDIPRYTLARAKKFVWPAVFYGANAVLALTALAHMNIAMYGVMKRCVPISTMLLAVVILKKGFPSRLTLVAVVMLSMGCVVAGYGDLFFHLNGYLCGICSNFTQAMYLLLVQKYSEKEQSTVDTLQLNSFNTLPFLIVACIVNGELSSLPEYDQFNQPLFYVVLLVAVASGCLLNYSLFLCTGLTSALTTSVVGGLKAMVQTIIGLFTFGGVSHNLSTFIGISMNLSGGMLYIYAKYKQNKQKISGDLKKVMSFSSSDALQQLASVKPGHRHVSNGNVAYYQSTDDNTSRTES
ncbi:UDP-galactose/UDP-glucose transporter 7-like [Haliotis rubra]|uniref:UDP-galactose/UDP-glucose transporter 7-like n=1 Tax=Haliotis rubra TaxID=36100 RepID=UPI001EE5E076|nr:UDP-galactose/UDP-glucose transporter 7-like [Haliotis rubra]XP_046567456.1 UDP-galactose/UDP-glucose transporter 7-like [Haliotis rubra]XP_046567462.1 UDP-galactose/UDP-glucose transporter 7-like [Haliotis rubra]